MTTQPPSATGIAHPGLREELARSEQAMATAEQLGHRARDALAEAQHQTSRARDAQVCPTRRDAAGATVVAPGSDAIA